MATAWMPATLFTNAAVLDVAAGELVPGQSVLVDDERISQVGRLLSAPATARTVDLHGMTLMPGLIDCNVHVTAATADLAQIVDWSPTYLSAQAAKIMREMLQRGFTTIRDAGGADFGLARAVAEGLIDGPRLIYGGRA